MVLVALAAATWTWVRPQGLGDAENPLRVLVVAQAEGEQTGVDAAQRVMELAGFEARIVDRRGLDTLAAQLRYDLDADADETERLRVALAVADELGYGFLAWSSPRAEALAGLDLDADVPGELRDWVVLSVGDLAFPHEVTFEPQSSEIVRLPGVGLLRALYQQSRFDADRDVLTHRPSVEELNLQRRIDPGQNLVRRVERLEATAGQIEKDIARLLNEEGRARPLGEPMQSGIAVPLADGDALAVVRDVQIRSADGATLDYDPADSITLTRLALAGDGAVERRTACTELTGDPEGRVRVGNFPELSASVGGGAVVWRTAIHGTRVFLVDGDATRDAAAPTDCGLRFRGRIPAPSPSDDRMGVPSEAGEVVRVRHDGDVDEAVVTLFAPNPTGDALMVELGRLAGVQLGSPVWLGDSIVAVPARVDHAPEDAETPEGDGASEPGEQIGDGDIVAKDAIYLFSTLHPGVALHLELDEIVEPEDRGKRLQALAAVGAAGEGLVVTLGRQPTLLARLDWAEPLGPRFDALAAALSEAGEPVADAGAPAPTEPGTLRELLPAAAITFAELMRSGDVYEPQVSADGRSLAFAWAPDDHRSALVGPRGKRRKVPAHHDIAVLDLEAARAGESTARRVSQGAVEDRKPGWSPGGQLLVFESIVQVSVTGRELGAPRVVVVDPQLARR